VTAGLREQLRQLAYRRDQLLLKPSFQSWVRLRLGEFRMHSLIYLIGLIVVILAILSFFGLR
jgi:hypothetical protein